MELAIVTGSCTATVKDSSLNGHKLAVVRTADETGTIVGGPEVALDVTSASAGQLVVVARGSAARQPAEVRATATDLTVIGIVDDITTRPAQGNRPSGNGKNRRKQSHD